MITERPSCMELEGESRIVWLEDISKLDYVRGALYSTSTSRTGKPTGWEGGDRRLVGYAELLPEVRPAVPGDTTFFYRRVFWLMSRDRDSGDPVYRHTNPIEAVDPRTVAPNVRGSQTVRVRGRQPEISTR